MNSRRKVLLVGWDAADWKVIHPLMDAGKMPNVQRLVEQGAMAHIATLHPPLSPMLWTSIATGKRPYKHGIHGFSEPTADGTGIQPVTNLSRKCKAVWNILNQNDLKSIVIGWWPSHPAEPIDGVTVSDHYHRSRGRLEDGWPLLPGTVHPPELADVLAEFRLHKEEVAGEMIESFVPKAQEVDQDKDPRLAGLASTLAECVSIHSAATWLIEKQEWDFFAVYYDAIDHFCHGFMKYHPPRQEFISQSDFDLYHQVVSAAYQLHDQMLGVLLGKIGPEVTVILMSDHGFHPDHLRPKAIPSIPAGPAIEHRDFGILAIKGPGIKCDQLFHGASVLDITPTLLTLFGLPVGADMDGKVLLGAFEVAPPVTAIPSWEDVDGRDGRHPPHRRLDPQSSREALEQLVALGYIARPDEDREKAVAETVRELRYNLAQAYQDAGRHAEALEILRALHEYDTNEQRFAVQRFVSCQALQHTDEMRSIVDDLDGRRRGLFLEAGEKLKEFSALARSRALARQPKVDTALALGEAPGQNPEAMESPEAPNADPVPPLRLTPEAGEGPDTRPVKPEPLLTKDEQKEYAYWRNLGRFQPPVVDYLKAQVHAAEGRASEALDCLGRVQEAHLARPGLFLQTAELYLKLRRWAEAEAVFRKALEVDPDNPHAHLGMCRIHLHHRNHAAMAQSALEALERFYQYPLGHFYLGIALRGMKDYRRAAAAFRTALSLNPNFAQAHLHLASILGLRLNDRAAALEHLRLYKELRSPTKAHGQSISAAGSVARSGPPLPAAAVPQLPLESNDSPAIGDGAVIVSGLPRSGTSMIMQMLAEGGHALLTDGIRAADTDNPLGYFEFEPVKELYRGAGWLDDAKGKAVKIVAPLLPHLPMEFPCHVIFVDREMDEILASQTRMIARRGEPIPDSSERQERLKAEFGRKVLQIKEFLGKRPKTRVLWLNHAEVINRPDAAAEAINRFLGGQLQVNAMVAAVKPSLHRNRIQAANLPLN